MAHARARHGQHFCCESIGTGTGNGCISIDKTHINLCDKLLYCAGSYMKDGGQVTCLDGRSARLTPEARAELEAARSTLPELLLAE